MYELDEACVGKFSFGSVERILSMLGEGGVECLQTSVMCQVVHKNALMAAVQQANACHLTKELPKS